MKTKLTPTEYAILDEIKDRWSPRAFSSEEVTDEELHKIFEAARWAPSSMNEQPWRFIYARKGTEAFDQMSEALMEGNYWAKEAPVLIFTAVRKTFKKNDKPNRTAQHDLGLAVGNLAAQATALGLSMHQMGGIYTDKAAEILEVPEDYEVMTAIALGKAGDANQLEEKLKNREMAERKRMPQSAFVFTGSFKSYKS